MIGPRIGVVVGLRVGVAVGISADELSSAAGGVAQTTLTVALTDSTDPVITAVNFTYAAVVTNTGSNSATSVSATVTLDASLTFVSGSGTGWTVNAVGQVVTCTRVTLAVGAGPTITIIVTSGGAAVTASSTLAATASNAPAPTPSTQTTAVKLVAKDPTSGRRLPASATQWADHVAYFLAIGTANFPNITVASLWLLQEPSGNLADSIGSVALTQSGVGHLYQQAVTGWTAQMVQTVDGVAGQKWINSTTAPNDNTTDTMLIGYLVVPAASPLVVRDVVGSSVKCDLRFNTTGKLRQVFGASQDLTVDNRGTVVLVGIQVDNTNSVSACYTTSEKLIGTYSLPASSVALWIGGQTSTPSGCGALYMFQLTGANARLTAANIKALYQSLGETIPWT